MDEKSYIEVSDDDLFKNKQAKKRYLLELLSISAVLRVFTMALYLGYRIQGTLLARPSFGRSQMAVSWMFLAIEVLFGAARIPTIWRSLSAMGKARFRAPLYLQGTQVPAVDIFITTCGEDLSVIMDTVRAACNLDYPRDKYRVIVLDDGNSPACKRSIETLSKEYPNLNYSARGALVKTHSKAANLNHGLDFVSKDGPSEMVAALDADMIPEPTWLRCMLPHILQDGEVAIANPPQSFYDMPKDDPVGHLSAACHMCNVAATQQDFHDKAWCNGSGFVCRRKAIDQIGGFPTGSLLEDMLTTMQLNANGWKSVLVNEPLQWGTVPESFTKNVKQMQRWTAGSLSLSKALQEMNEPQIGAELVEAGIATSIAKCTMCFLCLPVLLLTDSSLLIDRDVQRLRNLLLFATLDFAVNSIQGYLESGNADYCISVLQDFAQLWMSPYLAPDLLRYLFPWMPVLRNLPNFKPSGHAGDLEAHNQYRNSVIKRLQFILWDNSAVIHLMVLCTCIAGIARSFVTSFQPSHSSSLRTTTLHWVLQAGYPPAFLLWTSVICNAWVPIAYAIWPPHRPDRETLLYRDPVSKVAYPTTTARSQDHRMSSEWQFKIVATYYLVVMGLIWWL